MFRQTALELQPHLMFRVRIIWYAGCKTMLTESVELFITQRNLGSTFPDSTKGVRRCQYFLRLYYIGRKTRVFIYALSADETSSMFASSRHTITVLFSSRFKCPCPSGWQPYFRSNADRAYNTLHFASEVVCQRVSFWNSYFVVVCSHIFAKMQNKRLQSATEPQPD